MSTNKIRLKTILRTDFMLEEDTKCNFLSSRNCKLYIDLIFYVLIILIISFPILHCYCKVFLIARSQNFQMYYEILLTALNNNITDDANLGIANVFFFIGSCAIFVVDDGVIAYSSSN